MGFLENQGVADAFLQDIEFDIESAQAGKLAPKLQRHCMNRLKSYREREIITALQYQVLQKRLLDALNANVQISDREYATQNALLDGGQLSYYYGCADSDAEMSIICYPQAVISRFCVDSDPDKAGQTALQMRNDLLAWSTMHQYNTLTQFDDPQRDADIEHNHATVEDAVAYLLWRLQYLTGGIIQL